MSTVRTFNRLLRLRPIVVGGALVASTALVVGSQGPAARAAAPPPPATVAAAVGTSGATASYADLVARVAPSVITVRSERVVRQTAQPFPFADDPLLRRFFGPDGEMPARPHREGGLGSGVIVSADGYVLTNHHVVDGAQRIMVDLSDRRTLGAKLIGSDAASDLAVLKIDATGLTPLPFGDSRAARVGDVVLAFGNPLGIGQTVTAGIISAKGRATGLGEGTYEDFLQTDAPINQGNSGGALVNTRGELIGINSQIVSPSGGNIGIGFAIPAAMAQDVMGQLTHDGRVHRGQLGVTVEPVTSDLAKSLRMDQVRGALVSAVSPGSPAEAGGVKRGDVIVAIDDTPVSDANALRNEVASNKPGSVVKLQVLRGGREQALSVKLAERSEPTEAKGRRAAQEEGASLGLSIRPVSRDEARELGLDKASGLLVAGVDPDGPAARVGFREGDVIQEVDGRPVASAAALRDAVKAAGDRPALVLVSRAGQDVYLPLSGRG